MRELEGIPLEDALTMVGEGWSFLVEQAYDAKPDNVHIVTVKEKFGQLRIYIEPFDENFANVLDRIETWSAHYCEVCGAGGRLRNLSWIKTLCDAHNHERKKG